MKESEIKKVHEQEYKMLSEINRLCKKNNIQYFLAYGTALGAIRHNGFIPWDTDLDIMVDVESYEALYYVLKQELNEKFIFREFRLDEKYDSLQPRVTLRNDNGLLMHVDIYPMIGAPYNKFMQKIFNKITYFNQRLFFVKKVNADLNYKDKFRKRLIAKLVKKILYPISDKVLISINNRMKYKYSFDKSKYIYNLYGNYGQKEFIPKEWLDKVKYVQFEEAEFPVPYEYHKYLSHIYGDYMTPKKENYV